MRTVAAMTRRLAKRAVARWVWRETYRCLRLPWNQAQSAAGDVGDPAVPVEVRALERSELALYGNESTYDFSPQFLHGIASRDDLCVAAFAGGKLVSYCFFAVKPTAIDSYLRFHFPLRWIYVYKAFTHPAWRGRRLQQLVFLRARPEVSRWLHGLREPLGFVTLVMADNPPSLNAFARLGFKPFESFSVLRIRSRPRLLSGSEDEGRAFYIQATEET
jgi:hypothetical protein